MAGGHPKGSIDRPSSSSSFRKSSNNHSAGKKPSGAGFKPSSSSPFRKSNIKPFAGEKSTGTGDSKPQPPKAPSNSAKDNPTPKLGPTSSPSHPKLPNESTPHSAPGQTPPEAPLFFPNGRDPPPPHSYGFHMLERRAIVLVDGSERSYFALPPDYQHFTPPSRPVLPQGFDKRFPPLGPMSPEFRDRGELFVRDRNQDYWNSSGLGNSLKRKYGDDGERGWKEEREGRVVKEELARQRQHLLEYGNAGLNPNGYSLGLSERGQFAAGTSNPFPRDVEEIDELRAAKHMRVGGVWGYENMLGRQAGIGGDNVDLKHNDVDQGALKKAFLHFVKLINDDVNQKMKYLGNGKQTPLQCVACGRSSKDFPDMHGLIMHTYNPDRADLLVDHLGLYKALCVLMGWSYLKSPDNSKAYQSLSADEAAANQDDLIIWPPTVIIHNTNTGKSKEGRMEGLGNKAMDNKLRDFGFGSGKAKSVYGKEGHLGITLVKFAGDGSGLREATRLVEFFEKQSHGRKDWTRVQSLKSGKDDENNPYLVKVDQKTGEKDRVLYGYLGTGFDLDKVDFETRKKVSIESRREYNQSK